MSGASAPPDGARSEEELLELELLDAFQSALSRTRRAERGILSVVTDARQLLEYLEGRHPASLETGDILAYLRVLQRDRGQKPSTLRRKLASVRLFYRYLQREGHVSDNPTLGVTVESPAEQRPLPLSHAQTRRLIEASRTEPLWSAAILLMLTAGLKREELLQLRWSAVRTDADGITHIDVPSKSGRSVRSRTLSLPPRAGQALARLQSGVERSSADRVIPLSPRGLSYAVTQCAQRASLGHLEITPQRLRDTFAVHLLESLLRKDAEDPRALSRRGRLDVQRGLELGFLRILGVGRNRALVNHYRAVLLDRQNADGAEGVFLIDADLASADEL